MLAIFEVINLAKTILVKYQLGYLRGVFDDFESLIFIIGKEGKLLVMIGPYRESNFWNIF